MQTILADPPWKFHTAIFANGKEIGKCPYKLMKTQEICALPVKKLTTKNAALFLWTTDAHMEHALRVMAAWGFKYKTIAFVWIKMGKKGPVKRNGFYNKIKRSMLAWGEGGCATVHGGKTNAACLRPRWAPFGKTD